MQFKAIVGQEALKTRLIAQAKAGRVSHAQLFMGADGHGSLLLAIAFAQYLNCMAPTDTDSCGVCNACQKYQKLIHPDLHFTMPSIPVKKGEKALSQNHLKAWREQLLKQPYFSYTEWMAAIEAENKQGNITVAECHEIIQKLSLATFEGQFKVHILWKPELLGNEGNILLKIIEEPPQKTLFLFVTDAIDRVLPTILSRMQLVKIPPIALPELTAHIGQQYDLPENQAQSIAVLSNGNMLEALRFIAEEVNLNETMFINLLRMCFTGDGIGLSNWVMQADALGREKQKDLLTYSIHLLRECFLYRFGSATMLRLKGSEKKFVQDFSVYMFEENMGAMIKSLNDSIFYIERNGNAKLVFHTLGIAFMRYLAVARKLAATQAPQQGAIAQQPN